MKKTLLLAAFAATSLFASCNEELLTRIEYEAVPKEMSFRAYTGLQSVTKSAVDGTGFPQGYDILVSAYRNLDNVHKGDDKAADYFEGIHFRKDNTTGTWKEAKYWPFSGTLDFLAIASAGLNNAANGIVPTCKWGDSGNVAKQVVVTVPDNSTRFDDLLYGSLNGQSYVSSGNAIVFQHAYAAVVFTAKSNIAYNSSTNSGITIDSIAVNGAKCGGTLTVSNPAAGGSTGSLTASWSNLTSSRDYLHARVWNKDGKGIEAVEPELTGLHLAATAADMSIKPFGEAYVILPQQDAVPFTIYYTIHNGKKSDGITPLDNKLQYKYTTSEIWEMGKKYIYAIDITLNAVTINPEVTEWTTASSTKCQ